MTKKFHFLLLAKHLLTIILIVNSWISAPGKIHQMVCLTREKERLNIF